MKIIQRYTYFPTIVYLVGNKILIDNKTKLVSSVWTPTNTLRKVFELIK